VLHCSVSSEFQEIVLTARVAFSKRSWPFVLATAVPWLMCAGQRSITRLAALGGLRRSRSAYYRFLSDGKWRLELLFKSLFQLIVRRFSIHELTLVLDDTLCPKWGRSIWGTGSFFDHVRRPRPGFIWGHNWVVLSVVVRTGGHAWVALPFWIALYRPVKSCSPLAFRTRHQLAVSALTTVRTWFSGPIRLLADGAYANDSLVTPSVALGMAVVSRIRSDARLRAPHPARRSKGRHGRKPTLGKWLPKLKHLGQSRSAFHSQHVNIYGRRVHLLVRELEVYWPALRRVVKIVITRDPKRPARRAYLVTTDLDLSESDVIEAFAQRWTIEQMFSVAKQQMGLDSAEVRKERAVVRHAALCIALITWTEVWARGSRGKLRAQSFARKLAALRAETITQTIFSSGPRTRRSRRNANGLASIFTTATAAA
jgi:hypothetical protein